MTEARTSITAIRSALAAAADADYREQILTLVPGVRALGVRVPVLREQVVAFAKAHRELAFADVCALADELCATGVREEHLFASCLLARFRKPLATLPWARIAGWLRAVDNWETCDQLAMQVAAPRVAAEPALVRELVALARHRDPWRRRFALATSAALNQKGRKLAAETLQVCTELVKEQDPGVRKALGWALRSATPHDPEGVAAFLTRHRDALHKSVLREGAQKLPPALKRVLGV